MNSAPSSLNSWIRHCLVYHPILLYPVPARLCSYDSTTWLRAARATGPLSSRSCVGSTRSMPSVCDCNSHCCSPYLDNCLAPSTTSSAIGGSIHPVDNVWIAGMGTDGSAIPPSIMSSVEGGHLLRGIALLLCFHHAQSKICYH
jgi:hypothetical protein